MTSREQQRLAHSIYYASSTSEIKDDLAALIACLKTGQGALTRQEAGFLLWHHALDGDESVQLQLLDEGLGQACLLVLDLPTASSVDMTCAAGLLHTLATDDEELRDRIIRLRLGTKPCPSILVQQLKAGQDHLQLHAAGTLNKLACSNEARMAILRCWEHQVPYTVIVDVLNNVHNEQLATDVLEFMASMLQCQKEEAKAEAIKLGLHTATLAVLKYAKGHPTAVAATGLLLQLCSNTSIADTELINALVDLLGPPPKTVLDSVKKPRQLSTPTTPNPARDDSTAAKPTDGGRPALKVVLFSGDNNDDGPPEELLRSPSRAASPGSTKPLSAKAGLYTHGEADTPDTETPDISIRKKSPLSTTHGQPHRKADPHSPAVQAAVQAFVEVSTPRGGTYNKFASLAQSLSVNSIKFHWGSAIPIKLYSNTASCLYILAQDERLLKQISARLAASRLSAAAAAVQEAGDGSIKKGTKKVAKPTGPRKGKRAKLKLTKEQEDCLVAITGCLKFLTLIATNRFRVTYCPEALDLLIDLQEQSSRLLLRRNAAAVLVNLGLQFENLPELDAAKVPEVFFVEAPLRLTQDEILELLMEFPNHEHLAVLDPLLALARQ